MLLYLRLPATQPLEKDDPRRAEHQHDTHRGREAGTPADFAVEEIVRQRRQDRVARAEDHRGSEVGQGHHEGDKRSGGDRRNNEGQSNAKEGSPSACAEVFGSLFERSVHRLERSRRQQVDERIVLEREDEDDAPRPVDRRHGDADRAEDIAEKAVASEHRDPRVRADKRWREQRENGKGGEERRTENLEARRQKGEGNTKQERAGGTADRDDHAVDEGPVVVGRREELPIV
jgi:hypothetical protein